MRYPPALKAGGRPPGLKEKAWNRRYTCGPMRSSDERPPGERSVLDPTAVESLRLAMKRLRERGLTGAEPAAEVVRENIADWIASESDAGNGAFRLRIVKR